MNCTPFICGCIGVRTLFVLMAKYIPIRYLPLLGYGALLPAIGFMIIFITGSRPTGIEVGGRLIWWNHLRPVHASMYALFSYYAIRKIATAWRFLALDVTIGLVAWLTKPC